MQVSNTSSVYKSLTVSRILAALSVVCLVAPFVVGKLQVDHSGLTPLIIGEDLPEGLEHANAGALEGPGWHDESLTTSNNVIQENKLRNGGSFDIPTGGRPSPLFGATAYSQKMVRFEEFGTMNNQPGLLPQVPFPGTQYPSDDSPGDGPSGGGVDDDRVVLPGPPRRRKTRCNVDSFCML